MHLRNKSLKDNSVCDMRSFRIASNMDRDVRKYKELVKVRTIKYIISGVSNELGIYVVIE